MENIIENKKKFFAQYWGQKILKGFPEENSLTFRRVISSNMDRAILSSYLELTSLSQISDEDALWVAKEVFIFDFIEKSSDKHLIDKGMYHISNTGENFFTSIRRIDYFRSRGYALSFNGIDVDTLISWGWIKLKTNEKSEPKKELMFNN